MFCSHCKSTERCLHYLSSYILFLIFSELKLTHRCFLPVPYLQTDELWLILIIAFFCTSFSPSYFCQYENHLFCTSSSECVRVCVWAYDSSLPLARSWARIINSWLCFYFIFNTEWIIGLLFVLWSALESIPYQNILLPCGTICMLCPHREPWLLYVEENKFSLYHKWDRLTCTFY